MRRIIRLMAADGYLPTFHSANVINFQTSQHLAQKFRIAGLPLSNRLPDGSSLTSNGRCCRPYHHLWSAAVKFGTEVGRVGLTVWNEQRIRSAGLSRGISGLCLLRRIPSRPDSAPRFPPVSG